MSERDLLERASPPPVPASPRPAPLVTLAADYSVPGGEHWVRPQWRGIFEDPLSPAAKPCGSLPETLPDYSPPETHSNAITKGYLLLTYFYPLQCQQGLSTRLYASCDCYLLKE